jgi:hypothetical protein
MSKDDAEWKALDVARASYFDSLPLRDRKPEDLP